MTNNSTTRATKKSQNFKSNFFDSKLQKISVQLLTHKQFADFMHKESYDTLLHFITTSRITTENSTITNEMPGDRNRNSFCV